MACQSVESFFKTLFAACIKVVDESLILQVMLTSSSQGFEQLKKRLASDMLTVLNLSIWQCHRRRHFPRIDAFIKTRAMTHFLHVDHTMTRFVPRKFRLFWIIRQSIYAELCFKLKFWPMFTLLLHFKTIAKPRDCYSKTSHLSSTSQPEVSCARAFFPPSPPACNVSTVK